jgi:outer membrane protein OmpA-like peptidoglycan-associated protein
VHQRATVSAEPTHSREAAPAARRPQRAPSHSTEHSPWRGNQSRLRSLANPQPANSVLQRKLAIGATNDPLEIEADHTADRILRMPDQATSASPAAVSNAAPLTLHRCSCGGSSSGGSCDKCKDEAELQRKSSGPTPFSEAPAIVHEVLRSSGRSLDRATRSFFEPRFGHDFSGVRIHTGARAAESARQVNALAYTVGSNVVFRTEQFAPDTAHGRRLLAHELAHVVQQRQNGPSASSTLRRAGGPSASALAAKNAGPEPIRQPNPANGCFYDRNLNGPGKVHAFGTTRWVLSNFDIDQHYVKKEHFDFMKKVVAPKINATPAGKFLVMVVGEASTTADFDYNLDLSKWRANCVAEELVAAGLDDQHRTNIVAQTGELRGDLEQISQGIDPRIGKEDSTKRMVTIFLVPAEECTPAQKTRASHDFYAKVACYSPTEIRVNIGVNDSVHPIYRAFAWEHDPWPSGCTFIPGRAPDFKPSSDFVKTAVDLRLATKDPDDFFGPSDFTGPLTLFADVANEHLAKVFGMFEVFRIGLGGEWNPEACGAKSPTVHGTLVPRSPVLCKWAPDPIGHCDFIEKKEECSDDHKMAASKRFNGYMWGGSISGSEFLQLLESVASKFTSWIDRKLKIPSLIKHFLDPGGILLNVLFGTKDPNLDPPLTRSFVFAGVGNQGGGSSFTDHFKGAVAPEQDATEPSQLATENPNSILAHSDLSTYQGKVVIHGASNKIQLTTGAGTFNFFTPHLLCNDGGTRTYRGLFLPRGSVNCPDDISLPTPVEKECKDEEICPESTRTAGHKEFTAKVGRATLASFPGVGLEYAKKIGCGVGAAFVNIQSEDGPEEKQISRQFLVLFSDKSCRFTVEKAHVSFSTWFSRQLATNDPDEIFAPSDFTPGARLSKDADLSLISLSNFPVNFKLPGFFDPSCKGTSGGWGFSVPISAVECEPAPEPIHDTTPDVNHTDECNIYKQNHSDFVDTFIQSMGEPDYQAIFAKMSVGAAYVPPDEYNDYLLKVGQTISPAVFLGLAPNPQGGSPIQVVAFADLHIIRATPNRELVVRFLSEVCAFDSFGNVILIRPKLCIEGWAHALDSGILVPTKKDETIQPPQRHMRKTHVVQHKLAIGSANDPLEAEADRTADRVVRMPDQGISAPSAISHAAAPTLRRCSCGGTCNSCRQEDEKLRRKPSGPAAPAEAPPSVHETLRSPGTPLDPATRAFMEPRFGRDLSDVRIHTGDRAAESARQVDSLAYTVGNSIVFRTGSYLPHSEGGKRLLAHELAHVVQQGGAASMSVQRAPAESVTSLEPLEIVAERIARLAIGAVPKGTVSKVAEFNLKAGGTGPVISLVRNIKTGEIYVGLNMGTPPKLTQVIENAIESQEKRIIAGEVRVIHTAADAVGGHAEVNALDAAIKDLNPSMREEEIGATFEMHNVWLTGRRRLTTAPRCEHCARVTRGVRVTSSLFKAEGGATGEINVPPTGNGGSNEGVKYGKGAPSTSQPPTEPSVRTAPLLEQVPETAPIEVSPPRSIGVSAIKLVAVEIGLNVLIFAVNYYLEKRHAAKELRKLNNDLKRILPDINAKLKGKQAEIIQREGVFPLVYANVTVVYTRDRLDPDDYNDGSMNVQTVGISHQNFQVRERLIKEQNVVDQNDPLYSLTFSLPLFDEEAAEKDKPGPLENYKRVREFLKDPAYKVRLQSAITLYRLARQDQSLEVLVVRDLLGLLKDEDSLVRRVAVAFLSRLKAKVAIPYIREIIPIAEDDKQKDVIQRDLRELEKN